MEIWKRDGNLRDDDDPVACDLPLGWQRYYVDNWPLEKRLEAAGWKRRA